MKKLHQFDMVFDAQKMFRSILEAVSNPGTIINICEYSNKLYGDYKTLLSVASAILDNEVSFNTCNDLCLYSDIISLTLSKEAQLDKADYVFITDVSKNKIGEIIKHAKYGTLKDPHKSATIIISVDEIIGIVNSTISGPGINIAKELHITSYIDEVISARDSLFYEYPTGIDLIFVCKNGDIMAIPRKTKIESR